jgi:hypothetical protein
MPLAAIVERLHQQDTHGHDRDWPLTQAILHSAASTLCADAALQAVPLPKLPVIVGEISAYDQGNNLVDNSDTTRYNSYDKTWLSRTVTYLKGLAASSNQGFNWFLWCWNANSREYWKRASAMHCHSVMQAGLELNARQPLPCTLFTTTNAKCFGAHCMQRS